MAVKNLYPNLPGHLVEFKDGGLQVSTNSDIQGYDKSLLILGTALDGPINEPVRVDPITVSQLFGSEVNDKGYPNGATLTKCAKQAFKNGFSDVRCMRVTGTQASVDVIKSENQETETVDAEPIQITIPGTTHPVTFKFGCLPIAEPKNPGTPKLKMTLVTGGIRQAISLGGSGGTASVTYGDYDGELTIDAGKLSKHPEVEVEYDYKEISDADGVINDADTSAAFKALPDYHVPDIQGGVLVIDKQKDNPIKRIRTEDAVNGTGAFGTDPVPIFDATDGHVITYGLDATTAGTCNDAAITSLFYMTPYNSGSPADNSHKLPITKEGVPVVVYLLQDDGTGTITETELVFGTDYTIVNGNQVSLTNTTSYGQGDKIRVEYYSYQQKHTQQTITDPNAGIQAKEDAPDVVKISPIPVLSSVVVKDADGNEVPKDATSYNAGYIIETDEVNDELHIIFPAGNYQMGKTMTITYEMENVISENQSFTIVAKFGGKAYNGASVNITEETRDGVVGRRYTFTKPQEKCFGIGDKPFYFTSFDCATVGELKIALQRYALNNVFDIVADDEDLTLDDFPIGIAILDGGTDGLKPTANEMFEALSGQRNAEGYLTKRGAYQILENYHCDYIYVAGVYADTRQTVNKFSDFQHELAMLCAVLTYRTKMTHGFMDVKPNTNTTLVGIQKYVDKLTAMPNLHYMRDSEGNDIVDSDGNKMDIGWYTSLVVGPDPVMVSDKLGTYYGSPAIAYAALCASIKPQSAPTNKALPGVKGMKYRLSNKQMDALVGNRMVCFRLKDEGLSTATSVPYCVDGVTAGAPLCDYTRMSTVKVVTDVVDQIREVADPFIGEPNTVEQRNALAALISKRLTYIMESGEIQHYEFQINATLEQVLIGECTIALTLVPAMELRKITTVVSLRAAA